MKRCVMTVVSEPFVFGAIAMLTSFKQTNRYYNDAIVVLYNRDNAPLSDVAKDMLKREIPEVELQEVDNAHYASIFDFAENKVQTPPRLRAAFYILEAFRLDYDYIVALDSDMLILGDISRLFEIAEPFAVVRAFDHASEAYLPYFNTGTMVIRRDQGDAIEFESLVAALDGAKVDRSHGKADQAVLNLALRCKRRHYLSDRYNFSKRLVPVSERNPEVFLKMRDVRILHFLGEKPWNVKVKQREQKYRRIENMWWEHFTRATNKSTFRRLQASYIRQGDILHKAILDRLAADGLSRKDEAAIERAFVSYIF